MIFSASVFALALLTAPVGPTDTQLEQDGWTLLYEKDGVKAWKRKPDASSLAEFRGAGSIDADLYKVAAVIKDTNRATEWVADCLEASTLYEPEPGVQIKYNRTDVAWPVSDRDFVYREEDEWDPSTKTLTIHMSSVVDAKKPPVEGVVRGRLLMSEYQVTSLGAGKSWVVVRIHTDPSGNIPDRVANSVSRSWPLDTLRNLRRQSLMASGYDAWVQRLKTAHPMP